MNVPNPEKYNNSSHLKTQIFAIIYQPIHARKSQKRMTILVISFFKKKN